MARYLAVLTLSFTAVFAVALHTTSALSATNDGADASDHELVCDGETVREWRNPKLTELTQIPQLAVATKIGEEKPILIFKHSTTCGIAGRAAHRIDKLLTETEDPLPPFFMLKVRESRPVSNAIEELYGVKHESPQILLIKNGDAVWNTSHDEITAEALMAALEEHDAIPEKRSDDEKLPSGRE